MHAKAVNDAVAYIRSLAELRGRNADWAEKAVREAASLSASAALEQGVIDMEVRSVDELLTRADGRAMIVNGNRITRSEEHTSELQSLMRISYAVFCLQKKKKRKQTKKTKNKTQKNRKLQITDNQINKTYTVRYKEGKDKMYSNSTQKLST